MTWKDGMRYEGFWLDNRQHGHGVLVLPDLSKYVGQWKSDIDVIGSNRVWGKKNGFGVEYDKDG